MSEKANLDVGWLYGVDPKAESKLNERKEYGEAASPPDQEGPGGFAFRSAAKLG